MSNGLASVCGGGHYLPRGWGGSRFRNDDDGDHDVVFSPSCFDDAHEVAVTFLILRVNACRAKRFWLASARALAHI